jgi:hypothetical protein
LVENQDATDDVGGILVFTDYELCDDIILPFPYINACTKFLVLENKRLRIQTHLANGRCFHICCGDYLQGGKLYGVSVLA